MGETRSEFSAIVQQNVFLHNLDEFQSSIPTSSSKEYMSLDKAYLFKNQFYWEGLEKAY